MSAVIRVGGKLLLTVLVGTASFAFGAGMLRATVERRLDNQADSIYVNRIKYEELECRCTELQAVYWEQSARIDVLEEQFTRSGDILEALYEHETGLEWSGAR